MPAKFAFDDPDVALVALAGKLAVVDLESSLSIGVADGRVLSRAIVADRDSPAADVSAMDGYAIRLNQLQTDTPLKIVGQVTPGSPPPAMPDDGVLRIFTGAIVPAAAEAVIKREDTDEADGEVRLLRSAMAAKLGEHIRLAGENASAGSEVVPAGCLLHTGRVATAVNFGCFDVDVYRPVTVAVITTGDEVGLFTNQSPKPWQLQNSNRFAITSVLTRYPWIDVVETLHCRDDRDILHQAIETQLKTCDAVLLTGGVSMGDYDHVPDVVRDIGGEIVFHGLPLRPGKPILGAATGDGKLIVGLPGNPVSTTINCRRMAVPLLAKISGQTEWHLKPAKVELHEAGDKTLPLHWFRLVTLTSDGAAESVISLGSGDLVAMGRSDGFVQLPPHGRGKGPWPFFAW